MSVFARAIMGVPSTSKDIIALPGEIVQPRPSASEQILAHQVVGDTASLLNEAAQAQRVKRSILREVKAEAVNPDSSMTRSDIDAIGKLIRSLLPSGGQTNAPQVPQSSTPSGLLSQTRGRSAQAIDTFEHYRLSQEMRMVRQAFIKTKLDQARAETQIDRDDWNAEKIEEKVIEQTRSLAV